MTARTTPPFRADHVGSFLRPKYLLDARDQFFNQKSISAAQLREVEDKAITEIVKLVIRRRASACCDFRSAFALPTGRSRDRARQGDLDLRRRPATSAGGLVDTPPREHIVWPGLHPLFDLREEREQLGAAAIVTLFHGTFRTGFGRGRAPEGVEK